MSASALEGNYNGNKGIQLKDATIQLTINKCSHNRVKWECDTEIVHDVIKFMKQKIQRDHSGTKIHKM